MKVDISKTNSCLTRAKRIQILCFVVLLSLEDCAMKKTMQFISFIKTVTASLSGYRYTYHKVKVVRDHVE